MKKNILILSCWLLGLVPSMAQQRKMSDVQHIADSILNRPTRFGKKAKVVKTRRVIAASEVLSNKQDAFFICEAGSEGYAIISADERMIPVLGFSQSRGFDPTNMPAALQELLDSYTREYEALTSGKPMRPVKRKIEGVKEQVGPLFITQWGQNVPYNNRCPELRGEHCVTGCIAISTAQTLYYYQYPESAMGMVNYVSTTNQIPIQEDLSTFTFNWPFIKSSYKYGAMVKECEAVADLVYCCAAAVQMNFGLKESSATSTNQVKALVDNFGYDTDIAIIHRDYMAYNEWQALMINELNNKRPLIYAAVSPQVGGHSFSIDGYKADEEGYPFYHVNWGWEGNFDDYYKLSALEADGDEYSQEHEAIIGIKPDNGVKDSEFYWQAKEVILNPARINPKNTHKFTITVNNMFNYSYKAFVGRIYFYLRDANQKEILVGSQGLDNVSFCYGLRTLNVDGTLPNEIAEGDYTLIIRSKADDSNKYETVTYSSPKVLTVSTITEKYTPKMQVNEFTNVGEEENGRSMALRITEPKNAAKKPFTGWLKMAVADEEGNILQHFGNVYYIDGLEQGYYQPYAITFEGQLPDYLNDGAYRLYLVANQNGYLEWGIVTGYQGEDLFIPFRLEDGKVIYPTPLPEFYANIQVTDMQVTAFDPDTRHINMQMVNVLNLGDTPFNGVFSMVVYDEMGQLITEFGETQRVGTVLKYLSWLPNISYDFSGHLPNDLEDGHYTVKIAAKQNGYQGWSPIRGWVLQNGGIASMNEDLNFDFIIMNKKMYKVDTDGIRNVNVNDNDNGNGTGIYDLSGRKVNSQPSNLNSQLKKGIYVVGNKKVVK